MTRRLFLVIFTLLSAACASHGSFQNLEQNFGIERMNQDAPELHFSGSKGNDHKLSSYRGAPVVLHVWATWCTSCKVEIPRLAAAAKNWKGVTFLPVAVESDQDALKIRKFVGDIDKSIPVYMTSPEPATGTTPGYWAWGLPETYFINSDGRIVARARGMKPWADIPPADIQDLFTGK